MDCRSFRSQHLAYLDDTLPGTVMSEAQQHIMQCDACAAHDTMVRRSLLLARNHLRDIEPSDAFRERLQARLAACKQAPLGDEGEAYLDEPISSRGVWRTPTGWLAMAAGVGVVVTLSLQSTHWRTTEPVLPPVMASAPPPPAPPTPVVSPALVRAMSTGNPMWSVVQLLDEMPAHALATSAEFEFATYSR